MRGQSPAPHEPASRRIRFDAGCRGGARSGRRAMRHVEIPTSRRGRGGPRHSQGLIRSPVRMATRPLRFMRRRSRGCRRILWSTWRLRTSIRIRFRRGMSADDDALEELADSIKANGVVQPIMVRPGEEEGRYILVLGERRLQASKKAGKTTFRRWCGEFRCSRRRR